MTPPGDSADPPLRILCAEDDELLLACTAELLHLRGYEVDCATDGRQALDKLLKDRAAFDLLITDRQMPRLDGVGLVEESRRAGFSGKVIVFATALSESDRDRFGRLSVDAIVEKTSRAETLLEAVQRLSAAAAKAARCAGGSSPVSAAAA
jgi:two-component system response regulator MprA